MLILYIGIHNIFGMLITNSLILFQNVPPFLDLRIPSLLWIHSGMTGTQLYTKPSNFFLYAQLGTSITKDLLLSINVLKWFFYTVLGRGPGIIAGVQEWRLWPACWYDEFSGTTNLQSSVGDKLSQNKDVGLRYVPKCMSCLTTQNFIKLYIT